MTGVGARPGRRPRPGHRAPGVRRRHPPRRRAPRQARHPRHRPGVGSARSTRPPPGRARRPRRHDRRRPARSRCRASGRSGSDRPVIAVGETQYHGEPVAAVAAETQRRGRGGRPLVRVELRGAARRHDARRRPRPGAPLVQDPALRPDDPLAATNVLREHRYGWGDVDAAAARGGRRRRGHVRLPDGHPVRHRAARVHGRPDGDGIAIWSCDPAPVLAPAGHRRRARAAAREGPRVRARPGWRVRRQAAREVRAARRVPGAAHRPTGPARADASRRRSRPSAAVPRRSTSGPASAATGPLVFRDIGRTTSSAPTPTSPTGRSAKGSYTSNGPYSMPGRADRRPERAVAHRAVHRVPRLRQSRSRSGRSNRT